MKGVFAKIEIFGRVAVAAALGAFAGCALRPLAPKGGVAFVDDYDLSAASCGIGQKVQARRSVAGHPLTLDGRVHARGFGTRPESAVAFRVNDAVTAFAARVGIDADWRTASVWKRPPAVVFKVWVDGAVAWQSPVLLNSSKPVDVHVPLAGAREVVLETVGAAPWYGFEAAHADWADARFVYGPGAEIEALDDPSATAQLGILTPPEDPAPRINGADVWGVRPGHPVIFRVATSGRRPMRFTAKNLPAGVVLDAAKGVLRGVAPSTPGEYAVEVTAENAFGRARRVVTLAVGEEICLTPPMGWNSWNTCCYRLTQEKAMEAARVLEESGLGDHGWAYVNLDDWWQMNNFGCTRVAARQKDFGGREDVVGPARDAQGRIMPNRSFPDMKGFTDYVHGFGFKAGLYSSPGPRTCGECEGSYGHEAEDAASWAAWGFDFVKYDWCSYREVFTRETGRDFWDAATNADPKFREHYVKPYRLMGECLRRQNRDIVFSFCQYGVGRVQEWGQTAGANCWRSWDDLKDQWQWMEMALESRIAAEYWKYDRPGFWADPDMMIVGHQYSFGYDHPTFLTPNEQYTHVSLWAMVCSPLLIGCDLAKLDDFTRALLANDEVIAVSQDRLGRAARRYRHNDRESVWARPLANGDWAVALVNRFPLAREIRIEFAEFGLGGHFKVRDCWRQEDEGRAALGYAARVPPHATKLVRLTPLDCVKCDR